MEQKNDKKTIYRTIVFVLIIVIVFLALFSIDSKISERKYSKHIDVLKQENRRLGILLTDSQTRIAAVLESIEGSVEIVGEIEERIISGAEGSSNAISAIEASLTIATELGGLVGRIGEILSVGDLDQ